MSALHIILGVASSKPTAEPSVVYVGRSGSAAKAAMEASDSPRFLILSNVLGIPKNNPRAALNAERKAKAVAEAAPSAEAKPGKK